jgi:hypothetical protein
VHQTRYIQRRKVRQMLDVLVRLVVDYDRVGIISTVDNAMADMIDFGGIYFSFLTEAVKKMGERRGVVVDGLRFLVLGGTAEDFEREFRGRGRDVGY